ncbi:MAG TPA: hypothetical protein VHY31_05140 [Streptosporangiaceae bacterium]|jgi:hypothetical protein|nr:hypothetical protein [Streptosporangiaceae bacterium]
MMLTRAMRICLAVVALVAAGALASALVLALRPARAANGKPAAAPPPARKAVGPQARPSPRAQASPTADGYSFTTLDDATDPTFNQLLGINNNDHMTGYFGSGATGHPSKGYFVRAPYTQSGYVDLNYPHSVQTQLTGLNDEGIQVGFWSSQDHAGQVPDFGFYIAEGRFVPVNFPLRKPPRTPVNQLLGINDKDVAVGFYTDAAGRAHGYRYTVATKKFSVVAVSGVSVVAAAINNAGDVAGFVTSAKGVTAGFLAPPSGPATGLSFPGASLTEALGVNDTGEVVGDYRLGSGPGASTHGFTWTRQHGFTTVDDPAGPGNTTINGVNNVGNLVGFYTDRAGHTNGLLATPAG